MIFPFFRLFFIAVFFASSLFSKSIETFFGEIEVEEPVILDLIESPSFQRLKHIHQYGIAYYTTHKEEYNRYEHSLGVFAILRKNKAGLEEQIAGLLHDVSHTIFSHVGDWVFEREYQEEDYQSTIHNFYLAASGIEKILNKHGYTIDQVSPKRDEFVMLEQPLPNLCADRIDYNIQGAYYQNFLTKEEAIELFEGLSFVDGKWVIKNKGLAKKVMLFSIFMTKDCWGSATNYFMSRWLADAILQGLDIGLISWHELHFGIDEIIWDKLQASVDPMIRENMLKIKNPNDYFHLVDFKDADRFIKFKCRAIDPWIQVDKNITRLTSLDSELSKAFNQIKEKANTGWPARISL